jgi:Fe-S oxidoreductase
LRDRLIANLPRYAPYLSRLPWLANLRDRLPGAAALTEKLLGLSAKRPLPAWRFDVFPADATVLGPEAGPEVVLLPDTFNRYFEPDNLHAALDVLLTGGYRVHLVAPKDRGRPLCCGRTYLSVGQVDAARAEARRMLDTLEPYVARGVPVIGLEPSCLLTLRDEFEVLVPGAAAEALAARALLFEEFLAAEQVAGRLKLQFARRDGQRALLHGHCHQKAFAAMAAVEAALRLVPGLEVETVPSSCCGMAGAFGYGAETYEISMKMGEAALLPAVRDADAETLVIAGGTSCRHQIRDGAGREARHPARILRDALK